MPAMTIPLSEHEMTELQRRARQLGYHDVRAFALALIVGELQKDDSDYAPPPHLAVRSREDLEAKLLQGINSGPATEMTTEDWADIRIQALERAAERRAKG